MNGDVFGRYLPKELNNDSRKRRIIEPPKKISSKSAFKLKQEIFDQLKDSSTSPIVGHQKVKKL